MELSQYNHSFSISNKIGRLIWNFTYLFFFRPLGIRIFRQWRNNILRVFGAKIAKSATVYSSVKIWAPWNLEIGDYSCLGPKVDCYNQGKITIGSNTVISQKAYLCASSHDINDIKHTLIIKPITIKDKVWIAADAFIGPGVVIEDGVVVGARSAVFKNIEPWIVVGGNPAQKIKDRILTK